MARKKTYKDNINDTVVEKGTIVHAALNMSGSLYVKGQVVGEVANNGSVDVTGVIEGNVKCFSLEMSGIGYIKGDVKAAYDIKIFSGVIDGEVVGRNIAINGIINGNITALGDLRILAGATINGDVVASTVQVDQGAKINGFIGIKYQFRK